MNQNSKSRSTPTVELKAVTWGKDSHGLFDYENNQYEMKKFQISHPAKIYRINNDIIPTTKDEIPTSDSHKTEFLLNISQDAIAKEKFFINVNNNMNSQLAPINNQNIYLIVRSLKASDGKNQRGYNLTPGDILKLGRIEYRVIETQVGTNNLSVKKVAESYKDESFYDADNQILPNYDTDITCRYCLEQDCAAKGTPENLLLFPCKCTGASNGVHFLCLKTWIQHKIVSRTNNSTATYQWKKLECEVCKHVLPRMIKYRDQYHELITVEKPACPYII